MSSEFSFIGTVAKGKIQPPEPAAWIVYLAKYEGKRLVVTAQPEKVARSLKQNSRYWSLIVPVAAEVLSVGRDVPLSKDQAHYVLKSAFIGIIETELGPVPKSSAALEKPDFAKFSNAVEEWLVTKYGVVLDGVDE